MLHLQGRRQRQRQRQLYFVLIAVTCLQESSMWMKSSFPFLLLSLFICMVVGQPPPPPGLVERPLSELYSEDIPAEIKQELEDVTRNREEQSKVCVDEKHCFTEIAFPYCRHDHDCDCPSSWNYYYPSPTTIGGIQWYPFAHQRARVGRCVNPGNICHRGTWPFVYHRCTQLYQYRGFFYYTFNPYFRVRQLYVRIPDYCICPCRFPWCPLLDEAKAVDKATA